MELWIDRDSCMQFFDTKEVADILGNEKSKYAVSVTLTAEDAIDYKHYLAMSHKWQDKLRDLYSEVSCSNIT